MFRETTTFNRHDTDSSSDHRHVISNGMAERCNLVIKEMERHYKGYIVDYGTDLYFGSAMMSTSIISYLKSVDPSYTSRDGSNTLRKLEKEGFIIRNKVMNDDRKINGNGNVVWYSLRFDPRFVTIRFK